MVVSTLESLEWLMVGADRVVGQPRLSHSTSTSPLKHSNATLLIGFGQEISS